MTEHHVSSFSQAIQKACYKKSALLDESFGRYAVRSMIAGAFLTMSTAAGAYAADKLAHIHPDLSKFIFAFIFAFGLVYIVFLNGELATSNMMYLSAGLFNKAIKFKKAVQLLLLCTLFNLLGALLLGWLFGHSSAFKGLDAHSFVITTVQSKLARSSSQIFLEAILANAFVNVAILCSLLVKDQAAKITLVLSAIFMFVFLGNEHVVANFASFSIAMFSDYSSITGFECANILRQWLFAFCGNLVGGGLLIGVIYAWLNNSKTPYIEH